MATATVTHTFADGTTIVAAEHNTNFNDLVSFLNANVVHADGAVAMTGALQMGGNKITGLAAPTLATDAARKSEIDGHTHVGGDITAGTVAFARLPTGTGGAQVAVGNHGHNDKVAVAGDTMTGPLLLDASTTVAGLAFAADADTGLIKRTVGSGGFRLRADATDIAIVAGATFGPGSDNAIGLGSSSLRWTEVWAVDGSINTSDPRLKTNIRPLPSGALSRLRAVRPIAHDWLDRESQEDHLSFDADEVEAVIPEAVVVGENGVKGLRQRDMIATLWKAVQELSAEVDALKGA